MAVRIILNEEQYMRFFMAYFQDPTADDLTTSQWAQVTFGADDMDLFMGASEKDHYGYIDFKHAEDAVEWKLTWL